MSEGSEITQSVSTPDSVVVAKPVDTYFKNNHDTTITFQSIPIEKSSSVKSIFTHHELIPERNSPIVVTRHQTDWNLALIILWVSTIAWVRFFYGKRFRLLLQAPFSRRAQNQLLREGDLFSERLSVAGAFTYLIGLSLLLYQLHSFIFKYRVPLPFSDFTFYLLIFLVVILYWFGKVMMMLFLSSVFKTESTTREYLINVLALNSLAGTILLPVMVLSLYLQSFTILCIAMGIIALIFIFRFIKGFLTGLTLTKFSYIFLFVYLCTLEIVPLILVIKFSLIYYISKVQMN